jgi:copper resistance protein C
MKNAGRMFPMLRTAALGLACALIPMAAFAHAVLVASSPADHATLHGPDINIVLHYNSRVDGVRSEVMLADMSAHGAVQKLKLDPQKAPNDLSGHAHLKPGAYEIRWQALATDGHITRGVVPFTVK